MTGNDTNTKGMAMNSREREVFDYVSNSRGVWNITATPDLLRVMDRLVKKGVLRFVPRAGGNKGGDYFAEAPCGEDDCNIGRCPDQHLCRHGIDA